MILGEQGDGNVLLLGSGYCNFAFSRLDIGVTGAVFLRNEYPTVLVWCGASAVTPTLPTYICCTQSNQSNSYIAIAMLNHLLE